MARLTALTTRERWLAAFVACMMLANAESLAKTAPPIALCLLGVYAGLRLRARHLWLGVAVVVGSAGALLHLVGNGAQL